MLERLLRPNSLAFIGGTAAETALRQCQKFGFDGEMALVHPTRLSTPDRSVYRSVLDLPFVPDAALVAVNRDATTAVVTDLSAVGTGVAVCHASGYAEVGDDGAAMSEELLAAAAGMAIIGPNCYGTVNAIVGAALWPDEQGLTRCERGVAFVTQSGNMAVNLTMQQRGIDIAHVITLGNQIDIGIEACLEALVGDPSVTAVALHIEALTDVERFAAAALAAHAASIPVVALKTGVSHKGASIAASHTSSLVGDDTAYSALFSRVGVRRVKSIPELLDTTKLLSTIGALPGNRLVSMSCSGGEASLMADLAENLDVRFDDFAPEHAAEISSTLNDFVTMTNPLDYHTFIWGDRDRLEACFTAVASGEVDAAILVLDFPKPQLDDSSWWPTFEAFAAACAVASRPGVIVASMAENMPVRVREQADERGLVVVADMEQALRALEAAAWLGGVVPRPVIARPSPEHREIIYEPAAKQMLDAAGVPVPRRLVTDRAGAPAAGADVGYPVVLKLSGVAHKSDVGGVVLGIGDETGLKDALACFSAEHDTFLVEQHVEAIVAELLVDVRADSTCGVLLTIGCGGTMVELPSDTRSAMLPITRSEIEEMLRALPVFGLIAGLRGDVGGDLEATLSAIESIAGFALRDESIVEVEVNPLLVTPVGATVADALITRGLR